MQHSGHIGKIIVHPPAPDSVAARDRPFEVNRSGTHVITGAFGGFGLEAAKWLVALGARHLVLVGRQGPAAEEAKAVVDQFARDGVQVLAEACDVSDRGAVTRLFQTIAATLPAVVGVLHAAMVLEDALLANLDRARFERVVAPKVKGVDNLDAATRGMSLDYFVMFSSATTLMGNPGQANYVAANAYMEGVARRRAAAGQKALAIGWGPITDVGVLARSERLRTRFQKLTGVHGMRAREALDLMGQALGLPASESLAVMTISPSDGLFSADRLAVLKSPTYATFTRECQEGGEGAGQLDLEAIAKADGVDGVRRKLTDVIVSQLARVLHAREDEVSRTRPLGEIGLQLADAAGIRHELRGELRHPRGAYELGGGPDGGDSRHRGDVAARLPGDAGECRGARFCRTSHRDSRAEGGCGVERDLGSCHGEDQGSGILTPKPTLSPQAREHLFRRVESMQHAAE